MRKEFHNSRGMAVLAVLGFLVIGTWLVVLFLERIEMESRRNPPPQTLENLRTSSYQALELTIAVLEEIRSLDGGLYNPAQGWGNPLEYALVDRAFQYRPSNGRRAGASEVSDNQLPEDSVDIQFPAGVRLSVEVKDRNGKIPLEGTSEEQWVEIGKIIGFSQAEATLFRDSLLDWTDGDSNTRPFGAEQDQYRSQRLTYVPPNRPIQSLEEMRWILNVQDLLFDSAGRATEQWGLFRELVGIRASGEVNWNTAPFSYFQLKEEETGISAERMWSFLVGRDGVRGTFDDGILRPGIDSENLPRDRNGNFPPLDRQVGPLEIMIRAYQGETVFLLQVLLDPAQKDSGGVYPMQIVELRENFEKY